MISTSRYFESSVKTEDVTNTRGLDWDEMVLRKEV